MYREVMRPQIINNEKTVKSISGIGKAIMLLEVERSRVYQVGYRDETFDHVVYIVRTLQGDRKHDRVFTGYNNASETFDTLSFKLFGGN